MKNLKNDVFDICKRYCTKKELDIEASELAALTIYSIIQKGYFKGSYDFVRLYKNEFNELVLGYESININNSNNVIKGF